MASRGQRCTRLWRGAALGCDALTAQLAAAGQRLYPEPVLKRVRGTHVRSGPRLGVRARREAGARRETGLPALLAPRLAVRRALQVVAARVVRRRTCDRHAGRAQQVVAARVFLLSEGAHPAQHPNNRSHAFQLE